MWMDGDEWGKLVPARVLALEGEGGGGIADDGPQKVRLQGSLGQAGTENSNGNVRCRSVVANVAS